MYEMFGSVIVKYDRSQSIHMPSRFDWRVCSSPYSATRSRQARTNRSRPYVLDLALRVQAERLLDLDLDPQALAVEPVLVAQLSPSAGW